MSYIATFAFSEYEDREKAADEIYEKCNGYDAYDKSQNSEYYLIHIKKSCSDAGRAMNVCSFNGGKLYDY